MKKLLLLVMCLIVISCKVQKSNVYEHLKETSLKMEMNRSIIDGFYNGDTTKIYFKN
jgi:hypothetical protein